MQIFSHKSIGNNTLFMFFQNFSPNFLQVSNLIHTFATARILMRSTPHEQRARIYVQARPTYLLRLWAYFFAHNCRIDTEGRAPFVHAEHSA